MESWSEPAVCGTEAVDLLNCVADPQFDRERCLLFLDALRTCIIKKKVKKFSLAQQGNEAKPSSDSGKNES